MRRVIVLMAALALVAIGAVPALARSTQAPDRVEDLVWADGALRDTILLGDLVATPGNAHSFDALYLVPGQNPVAEAFRGPDYNGGRWLPTPITWHSEPYLLTSAADVHAAAAAGHLHIGEPMYDMAFLCPLVG